MKGCIYKVPVLAKLPGVKKLQWFNEEVFLPKDSSNKECYFFDGVGVVDGILHSYHQKSDLINLNFREIKPFDIRGTLTIYYRNDYTSRIVSDFVGSSFIFFYKKNGYELYSSCLKSLKEVLVALEVNLLKSVEYKACENIFGNGGFGLTAYEDIFTLPENSMVIATNYSIKVVQESICHWLLKTDNYENCLELAKKDILNNIKAVMNSGYSHKLAHITGGMDSRLVVAAIDYLNAVDDFELGCFGKPGDLDYDNAFLVAGVLKAKFSNRENYIEREYPRTIEEKYSWEFIATEGMLSNQSFHKGLAVNSDLLILSGGYGEFLRSFYSNKESINQAWSNYDELSFFKKLSEGLSGDSSLIKKELLLAILDKFQLFLEEIKLFGMTKCHTAELFYMLIRNRYYLGNITKIASKFTSRFDPLYSPYLFKLAYLIDERSRMQGVPLFDLMWRLSPILTKLPFGTTAWDDELINSKEVKVGAPTHNSPTLLDIEKKSAQAQGSYMPAISKENRALAKKMKAAAWQVQIYPQLQKKSLLLWEKHRGILEKFYNQEALDFYLKRKHRNRVDIRKVINIYATMLWLVY